MARQRASEERLQAALSQLIQEEAGVLARRYGVEAKRIERILMRTSRTYLRDDAPDWLVVKDVEGVRTCFWPSIWHALECLPPETALKVFENEDDLIKLGDRILAAQDIANWRTPLCNLNELADLVDRFLSFLRLNREHLVETGHPRTWFEHSPWLHERLARLYYIKLPEFSSMTIDEQGSWLFDYYWRCGGQERLLGTGRYDEAPTIEVFSSQDASRIERERGKFFELKISIIERLLDSVRARCADNLWADCLELLAGTFSSDDVDFLLRMDGLYIGYNIETKKLVGKGLPVSPGGFADLLGEIGYFEKEITIGTVSRTRDALGTLIEIHCPGSPRLAISSYFEIIGRRERKILDESSDLLMSLTKQEIDFWQEYESRVMAALKDAFYKQIVRTTRLKRKDNRRLEPKLRDFDKVLQTYIDTNSGVPDFWSILQETELKSEDCIFRQDGDYWTMSYMGTQKRLAHRKGFRFIQYLLDHPDKEISVQELLIHTDKLVETAEEISGEVAKQTGLRVSSMRDAGPVVDEKGLEALREARRDALKELEIAEKYNDIGRKEQAAETIDAIETELTRAMGYKGHPKKLGANFDKLRPRVTKAINDARKAINKRHPSLGEHLRKTIKTGAFCSYRPGHDVSIPWVLH